MLLHDGCQQLNTENEATSSTILRTVTCAFLDTSDTSDVIVAESALSLSLFDVPFGKCVEMSFTTTYVNVGPSAANLSCFASIFVGIHPPM